MDLFLLIDSGHLVWKRTWVMNQISVNRPHPAQTVTVIPVASTPASAPLPSWRTTVSVDASVWAQVWV